MADKEYWLKIHSESLSELMTAINRLYLAEFRLEEAELSESLKKLFNNTSNQMSKLAGELLTQYEKETGQYVDFMEGWGFRSEWERELNESIADCDAGKGIPIEEVKEHLKQRYSDV